MAKYVRGVNCWHKVAAENVEACGHDAYRTVCGAKVVKSQKCEEHASPPAGVCPPCGAGKTAPAHLLR